MLKYMVIPAALGVSIGISAIALAASPHDKQSEMSSYTDSGYYTPFWDYERNLGHGYKSNPDYHRNEFHGEQAHPGYLGTDVGPPMSSWIALTIP